MKFPILMLFLIGAAAFAADEKKEEKTPMNSSNEVAVIKTSEGDMVVQFWTDAAPKTIENFKKLARQGFYDGTILMLSITTRLLGLLGSPVLFLVTGISPIFSSTSWPLISLPKVVY